MNAKFAEMMKKVINGEGPVKVDNSEKFEPEVEDWEGEFAAYLIVERDKGIYSTEKGARAFSVSRSDEVIDAETIIELGRFNAKSSTAFMTAKEMFAAEVKAWMGEE